MHKIPGRISRLSFEQALIHKSIASAAITAIRVVDKDEPVYKVRTMDEVIASSVQGRRFRTLLMSLFAVLALTLAAIGTYGLMAYTVAQRSQEIGIRVALGAQPNQVRMLVIGQGLRLAGYGIGAGLMISLELTRLLSGILYGVKSTDPLSFVMTVFVLVFTSFVASCIPAYRAVKTDPASLCRGR